MSLRRTELFVGLLAILVINVSLVVIVYRFVNARLDPSPLLASHSNDVGTVAATSSASQAVSAPSATDVEAMPLANGDYVEVLPTTDKRVHFETDAETSNARPLENSMLVADIAVDADYEYFAKTFKGNLVDATNYVTTLVRAVSAIYERDIHVQLRPTFVRIATQPGAPWTANNISSELLQVKAYWTAKGAGQPRAAVLFLSGRNLGGGLAYRSGLCTQDFGYAVVGSIQGTFTTTPSDDTWDLVSVAHELGHIFGSRHSHCYKRGGDPASWYDECYSQQESSGCYSGPVHSTNGTIMSYCYVAGGSMARINPISFSDGDPVMTSIMRQTAESALSGNTDGCLTYAQESMPDPQRR